jgi:HlyD family secretion protein
VVALAGVAIFSSAYGLLYWTARRRLMANGETITQMNRKRTQLMQEGFAGIKDTLLLGRQADFNNRFQKASRTLANVQGTNEVLGKLPRYAMELVAYGSIIVLILFLIRLHKGDTSAFLPVLAVYALAGFKLLPAFQQMYVSLTTIRANLASFTNLRGDLKASHNQRSEQPPENSGRLHVNDAITLENICFRYPGKDFDALDNLTITIPGQQVIGLVGSSGSGKSTTIDVLLGLLTPDAGKLCVDGISVTETNKRAWQNSVGYVPQSIFLADATIRENIAFGLPPERIDESRIEQAVRMAHLEELVQTLSLGLDTRVGERGVQLSGGQRQRIGIARALYDDADVLVLDEATSALDGITEKLVMDAIHDFSGKKTIIMIAHRLSTVRQCDRIYLLEQGAVINEGSYDELVSVSPIFEKMAQHSY